MTTYKHFPKQPDWWVWGGGAIVVLIVIAAAVYGFELFGSGATDLGAPVVQQSQ